MKHLDPEKFDKQSYEQNCQDFTTEYNRIGDYVHIYTEAVDTATDRHYDRIDDWLYRAGERSEASFVEIVSAQTRYIEDQTKELEEAIGNTTKATNDALSILLIPQDYGILLRIKEQAVRSDGSLAHDEALLQEASSPQANLAIQAGLDYLVWQEVKKQTQLGAKESVPYEANFRAKAALTQASSEAVRSAMQAGLDHTVWGELCSIANSAGVARARIDIMKMFDYASSPVARQAMQAGLDYFVWQEARDRTKQFGRDNDSVWDVLHTASDQISREAMEALLPKPEHRVYPSTRNRTWNRIFNDVFEGARDFDTGSGGQQPPHLPHESQTRPRSADQEAERIIQAAIAASTSAQGRSPFGWLKNAEKTDVKRVIATVKHMRKQAEEKGEEITDRKVYLCYRRKVEADDASDTVKESLNILTALMGGDPNGKLPF